MAPTATASAPPFYEPGAPPCVIPLLIVETDIPELSPDVVPTLHQDIDMSQPVRRTVHVAASPPPHHTRIHASPPPPPARIAASPASRHQRSVSVGPASTRLRASSKGPEPRASSKAPEPRASSKAPEAEGVANDDPDSDCDSGSALSSIPEDEDADEQNHDIVMKIPKPAGEVSCLNRGGYKLEDALQWSAARMRTFKAVINQLVDKHLDATLSIAGQSESRMCLVRAEAVERLPALEMYKQEWLVVDAVKQRLKYTSSKARQAVQDAVAKIGQPHTRRK
ncbi:hypothetical protein C8Q79DRAFT_1015329 [Trametes meyenii]|nr:hypothetical protein C8Q79DRAFT_1015329 [Trametes meyenii]